MLAHVVSSRLALRFTPQGQLASALKRTQQLQPPMLRAASTEASKQADPAAAPAAPAGPGKTTRSAFPTSSLAGAAPASAASSTASGRSARAPPPKQPNWLPWILGGAALVGGSGLFYVMGKPDDDYPNDEYSKDFLPIAYFNRASKRIDNLIKYYTEPSSELLLPPPLPAPYQRPYTLVIELDETLVHSTWNRETGWRTVKRPGLEYFLAYLSEFFEIVIFTKQTVMYAAPILDKIDPSNYIMYRLYRDSTRYENGTYCKDLSRLNRDLSKVIVIESDASRVYQQDNVIQLAPWKGDMSDRELLAYLPFLETLAISGTPDVREVMKAYSGTHIPSAFAENQRRVKAIQQTQPAPKGLGSLFKGKAAPDLQEQQAQQHKQFVQVMQQRQSAAAQQPPQPPQPPQPQEGSQEQGKSGGIWGWFK